MFMCFVRMVGVCVCICGMSEASQFLKGRAAELGSLIDSAEAEGI